MWKFLNPKIFERSEPKPNHKPNLKPKPNPHSHPNPEHKLNLKPNPKPQTNPRAHVWYCYLPDLNLNPNIDDSTVIGGRPNDFGENGKN